MIRSRTRFWLPRALVACGGLALLGLLAAAMPITRTANAQADPGKQRNELIQEARRTNELLTEIRDLLKEQAGPPKTDKAGTKGGGR